MTGPSGPFVVPTDTPPARSRGFLLGLVLGLVVTIGVVGAEKAGVLPHLSGGSPAYGEGPQDVPFTDPDRLQAALDAAVADVGSTRATQVLVEDGEFSVVLFDPDTNLWSRYSEYDFYPAGEGSSEPLPAQPPVEAEFALDVVSAPALVEAVETGNRALGNDAEDVSFLQLVAERPFPAYGDVLLIVSDRYGSAGARVWLTPDGTVLRAEVE